MIKTVNARHWFNVPDAEPQPNSGDTVLDISTFEPLKDALEKYIRTGEIIGDLNRLHFHSDMIENLQSSDYEDPLMYRGYDRLELERYHMEEMRAILSENEHLAKYVKTKDQKPTSDETSQSRVEPKSEASSEKVSKSVQAKPAETD